MAIKRRVVDTTLEKKILTGMIVSRTFIVNVKEIYAPELFELKYANLICEWCFSYQDTYDTAPRYEIEDIFNKWVKTDPDEELVKYVADFLSNLSDEFEDADKFNADYWLDSAVAYFNTRSLLVLSDGLKDCATANDHEGAERLLHAHRNIEKAVSAGVDPFTDKEAIRKSFTGTGESLFKIPGALGRLMNSEFTRESFVALMGPEKRGKCQKDTSNIHLSDGTIKTIKEVVDSKIQNIITFNESTQKFESSKVTDFYDNGPKECYEVITRTGRKTTPTLNHPYLTPTGWKELSELSVGDRVAVPKTLSFFGAIANKKEYLRILAYLIAEGGLTSGSTPNFTSTYDAIRNDLEHCVSLFNCKITWDVNRYSGYVVGNDTSGINRIARVLRRQGLAGCHSRDKFIPDVIYKQTKEGVAEFLKTLFTCDGSVFHDGIEYSSASQKMLMQIQHLLTRFGVVCKVKYKRAKCKDKEYDHWCLSIRDYYNIKLFVEEIGFDFHKKEKAIEVLANYDGRDKKSFLDSFPTEIVCQVKDMIVEQFKETGIAPQTRIGKALMKQFNASICNNKPLMRTTLEQVQAKAKLPALQTILDSEILWDTIEAIIPIGKHHTYDLTVAKHHNFVADNCLVHNTWWLKYFAMQARRHKCKVAFFQAGDMSQDQMIRRMMISITQKSDKIKYCGEMLIPVLDCLHNQEDTCNKKQRTCDFGVNTEEFEYDPDYIPCVECNKGNGNFYDFKGAVWYRKRKAIKPLTPREAYEASAKNSKQIRAEQFKLDTYPNMSLSVSGIKRRLEKWERTEGFIPDVILIDYADIMAPEKGSNEFRHQQNATWMALRGLSQEYHCCVITATQASASSYNKESIGREDFSEDKRKYAHVTAMYGLNQTPIEKKMGIMRIAPIVIREDDYDERYNVRVLQCLQIGRPYIASF